MCWYALAMKQGVSSRQPTLVGNTLNASRKTYDSNRKTLKSKFETLTNTRNILRENTSTL